MNVSVRIQQVRPALAGCQSIATHVLFLIHSALHSSRVVKLWEVPKNPWTSAVRIQHTKFTAVQHGYDKAYTAEGLCRIYSQRTSHLPSLLSVNKTGKCCFCILTRCIECRPSSHEKAFFLIPFRPSVCLSNAWIVTKWQKVLHRFVYHMN